MATPRSRTLLSARDPTGVLTRSAKSIVKRTLPRHTPRHLSRQEVDKLLTRAMRTNDPEEVVEDTVKQSSQRVGRRVIVRNVVVPAKREVKVPVKKLDIKQVPQRKRVKVKRLVKVPGWKEVDEEYTVVKERPKIVQKEVWVKKIVEEEVMEPYTVKKTRKKKVPVEVLKEVEEWQDVDVTADEAVQVDGYRVDEVEDSKVVQIREEQLYELVPRLLTGRRILSARSLGVEEHKPHLTRHLGNRTFSPRSVVDVPEDEFPDDVERLPPMARHTHTHIGVVVAQRDSEQRGPVVKALRAGGPAEAAGLQVGDVIVAVDDEATRDLFSMHNAVYSHGEAQTWTAVRGNEQFRAHIRKHVQTARMTARGTARRTARGTARRY